MTKTIVLIYDSWLNSRGWEDVADTALDWAVEHARPGRTASVETPVAA